MKADFCVWARALPPWPFRAVLLVITLLAALLLGSHET